ncbi:UNVERIFIED_CONTAM: hypothetical protein FKN15_055954 [Acipenser sinensis]
MLVILAGIFVVHVLSLILLLIATIDNVSPADQRWGSSVFISVIETKLSPADQL